MRLRNFNLWFRHKFDLRFRHFGHWFRNLDIWLWFFDHWQGFRNGWSFFIFTVTLLHACWKSFCECW